MKFSLARRTCWHKKVNALNRRLSTLQAKQIPVLDLTESNPTHCGFSYPQDYLKALSSPENFLYKPDPQGLRSAREAVVKYYAHRGYALDAQDVVLTASSSEAYSFLLRLLVDPGKKVLIPRPSYPLFQFLLDINDVAYDYYPLVYEGQWRVDWETLAQKIDAKTRAIILVNPNNPTGSYIIPEELNVINGLCRRHKVSIISDEVFFDYSWERSAPFSCAGNQNVLTFVLGGASKTLCLPQMKCSWILVSGPDKIRHEALDRLEIIADTYLSVNTPVQNALGSWLDHAKDIQQQVLAQVRQNRQWLLCHMDAHTQLLSCQGGWYATVRIPAVKSEEEWALEFLQKDHVLVYPGYFFDMTGGVYMVVSLLPPSGIFQEAWGRVRKRLDHV